MIVFVPLEKMGKLDIVRSANLTEKEEKTLISENIPEEKKQKLAKLFLASFSAVLSIVSPNKLKDLTDEISKGLVINTKNVEVLANKIMDNKSYSDIKVDGVTITFEDQLEFLTIMDKYDKNSNSKEIYNYDRRA